MNQRNKIKLESINPFLIFLVIAICSNNFKTFASSKYNYLYDNLPFEMPVLNQPLFPENIVYLNDLGGVPDGITLNTEAFEKAMEALSAKGGGKLIVKSGIWLTGPIVFRSNINLHLEKGALIVFSSDFNLYPLIKTSYEGLETYRCQSPVSGKNIENIAITDDGAINGSGEAWRPLKKGKVTENHWNSVIKSGGVLKDPAYWFPTEKSLKGELMSANTQKNNMNEEDWLSVKDYLRPVMISFIECKNVYLEGVLFENSPSWNIHPLMCENVIIDNIKVRNPSYSQNGDGLDLESCKNCIVIDCSFDVGDDAICIKSGKDEDGRRRARPTENVIIENCRVFKGHGGFVVGSEMSGGVRNISVSNCQFMGTDVGLRFKSARGRGGIVENIYINNINMFNIATEALLFDLYYFSQKDPSGNQIYKVDETTPVFRNIYVKNITARNINRAMYFNGLPEMNIDNINIQNTIITAKKGAELSEAKNINFENVMIYTENSPALMLNNIKNLKASDLKYSENVKTVVEIRGIDNKDIQLPESLKSKTNKISSQ